jgi:dihydroxyacid dehydratase/phosphogluconate dehydratase
MSGTAYGTCVLRVAPESYVGGSLAHVRTGDLIALDIPNRRIDLLVPGSELQLRRSKWTTPPAAGDRGYLALYRQRVTQANEGCDFDFLRPLQPPRYSPSRLLACVPMRSRRHASQQ